MESRFKKKGFTLVELLVVISIIGLLGSIIMVRVNDARDSARAAKVAQDFQNLEKAWRLWQADTGSKFLHENVYGNINAHAPCHDEPAIMDTDLGQNVSNFPGWKGPYVSGDQGPYGGGYSYDNDLDQWTNGDVNRGVNISLGWCTPGETTTYTGLAPKIDQIFDKGDGPANGKFRWGINPNQGNLQYLIAPNSES